MIFVCCSKRSVRAARATGASLVVPGVWAVAPRALASCVCTNIKVKIGTGSRNFARGWLYRSAERTVKARSFVHGYVSKARYLASGLSAARR